MSEGASILVTGGAGYIGSHTVLQLAGRGERVVVLDDLSTGFRQAVRDVPLIVGNVGDRKLVDQLLAEHQVDTIVHCAARGGRSCRNQALRVFLDRRGVRHPGQRHGL